jgi:SAM-dependent methyltransferase
MDKAYWENIFERYDEEIFDVLENDHNEVIVSFLEKFASSEKIIADIGCGIGKWLPLLSSQFGKVVAIDFSESNVDYAAKKYKGLENVTYEVGDMTVGLKSSFRFDLILCVNAVITESYPKRQAFFKNLSGGLQKDGHLVLVVPSLESALYVEYILNKCDRKNGISENEVDNEAHNAGHDEFKKGIVNLNQVPTKHYLEEELIDILYEFGFAIQKIAKVEYTWDTEIGKVPGWLKSPYPWDWVVLAKKSKQ